jgi:adenylate cyclase
MHDAPSDRGTDTARLTADELARLSGDTVERVEELRSRGVIGPDRDGRYAAGDVHRVRVIDGFEAAGVPLDVLVTAQEAGLISVAYYDELHAPPGRPSGRDYGAFRESLGTVGELLPTLFAAFGVAEPDAASHLSVKDEVFIGDLATLVVATRHPDLALRVVRHYGEATRRASVAALETYAEVIERLEPDFAGVPSREVYVRHFLPWARLARHAPVIAEWLATRHISAAIDDYSVQATEQVLEGAGYVPQRPDADPAVAFLDLTGFTRLSQERGDAVAAEIALRLGELASAVATVHGGRVVKLLGDGVLMRFDGIVPAVEGSLGLMDRLAAGDFPSGHVGIAQGPIVARDGDIFGRTVNLAARISDVTPSGEVYVPVSSGGALAGRFAVEPVGAETLAGIGPVELARVGRL